MCVQCGRERNIGVARSSKFCTQRCIISWLEANPGKTPRDAGGSGEESVAVASVPSAPLPTTPTSAPSSDQDSPKPIPRALKNLQIDMAKPGMKLSKSSDESDSEGNKAKKAPPRLVTQEAVSAVDDSMQVALVESLAAMISKQTNANSKAMSSPAGSKADRNSNTQVTSVVKVTPTPSLGEVDRTPGGKGGVTKVSLGEVDRTPVGKGGVTKVSAKGAVKRVVTSTTPQTASATKKPKMSAKTSAQPSQKSVSFNLKPAEVEGSTVTPIKPIPISLDKIASYFQPKKSHVKIPPGKLFLIAQKCVQIAK